MSILLQVTSTDESAVPTDSSEGLLNLLLLADSSLQECSSDPSKDMPDEPQAATAQWGTDVIGTDATESVTLSMSLQTAEVQPSTAFASMQHPTVAGKLTATFVDSNNAHLAVSQCKPPLLVLV